MISKRKTTRRCAILIPVSNEVLCSDGECSAEIPAANGSLFWTRDDLDLAYERGARVTCPDCETEQRLSMVHS